MVAAVVVREWLGAQPLEHRGRRRLTVVGEVESLAELRVDVAGSFGCCFDSCFGGSV
jgi:hypothetical protein